MLTSLKQHSFFIFRITVCVKFCIYRCRELMHKSQAHGVCDLCTNQGCKIISELHVNHSSSYFCHLENYHGLGLFQNILHTL